MASPYRPEAGQDRPQELSPFCLVHGTLRQDFDADGNRYLNPVCYSCLPDHRDECPRAQLVNRFALVSLTSTTLPELWCMCGNRRALLQLASPPPLSSEPDKEREAEIEQSYNAGAITADSWPGSSNMRAERVTVLSIVAALWSMEFNWYFLLEQNAREHAAHQAHVEACRRTICGSYQHLRPDCPPQHTWILDWPSFTDEVIESVWCNPMLAAKWEDLVCWRADVQYWLARTPAWARLIFDLRARGKSERDIAHQMGITRYMARKRLKWLGRFLSNAAESWWSHAKSTRELRQVEIVLAGLSVGDNARAGVPHAADSTSQGAHASHTSGQTADSEALPGQSQAADRSVYARLASASIRAAAAKR